MPNSALKRRVVFDNLEAKFGTALMIVAQPASIDALPLTVTGNASCEVTRPPWLSIRRTAAPYPGEAKTNAKDAAAIADAARSRSLEPTAELTADSTVPTGFDQNLAAEATLTSNLILLWARD